MFADKARSYPRVTKGSGLTHKHEVIQKRLVTDKHSSLFDPFVNYSHNEHRTLDSRIMS